VVNQKAGTALTYGTIFPFAGSNTTGRVAESLGRKWIAIEKDAAYADDSQLRFMTDGEPVSSIGQNLLF
jgi:DNA modification methylase